MRTKITKLLFFGKKKLGEWLPSRREGVIGRPLLSLQVEILEYVPSHTILPFLDLVLDTYMGILCENSLSCTLTICT